MFYNWFKSNVQVLNTILLVIIISQLIDYFNMRLINDKIIPVAYLVSIALLYLSFRESQRSNRIVISQKIYDEFYKKIEELQKENNEPVFSLNERFTYIKIPNNLKYKAFSSGLFEILKSINNEFERQKIYSINLNEIEADGSLTSIRSLTEEILIIKEKIRNYIDTCFTTLSLYKTINQSILEKEQKEILIRKLSYLSSDYISLCSKKYNKKLSTEKLVHLDLNLPEAKHVDGKWKIEKNTKIVQAVFYVPYNTMNELNKKYNIIFD